MPKTTSSVQKDSLNKVLISVVILFFVALVVMSVKYVLIKRSWNMYAVQTLQSTDMRRQMGSVEDASTVAMTVGQFPSTAPIYKDAKELQTYVTDFSKQTHRDLVVMDTNKVIWADTIPANVGKTFAEDKGGEIAKTIADGTERSFTETSVDYPNGLDQTVVPLKDATGKTVGAVVLSSSPIFN